MAMSRGLATVVDLFNREIVGFKMDDNHRAGLVCSTFDGRLASFGPSVRQPINDEGAVVLNPKVDGCLNVGG